VNISTLGSLITRVEQHLAKADSVSSTSSTAETAIAPATTVKRQMSKQMSKREILATVCNSQERVVAAALHGYAHADSNLSDSNVYSSASTSNSNSSSSNMSTQASTVIDSWSANDDSCSADSSILSVTARSRFESTLALLQVHPNKIVRVDNNPIGKGGFAKVYRVKHAGQIRAAKVSAVMYSKGCDVPILLCNVQCCVRYWFTIYSRPYTQHASSLIEASTLYSCLCYGTDCSILQYCTHSVTAT
jgi:hypothetical protein